MRARLVKPFALVLGVVLLLGSGALGSLPLPLDALIPGLVARSGILSAGAARTHAASSRAAPAQAAPGGGYVVIFTGSKEYHWPSCPLVQSSPGVMVLTRAQANGKGYKPHDDCDPANAPPGTIAGSGAPGGAAGTARGRTTGPVHVYVSKGEAKYHRADCKVLPKDAKRVLLDKDTVKGRWPCTVCNPPIRGAGSRSMR